jgi:hypothetical protein
MQQAAINTVKESATTTSPTPVKMSLDIQVSNPLVIVPVTSTSDEKYMVLDLGIYQPFTLLHCLHWLLWEYTNIAKVFLRSATQFRNTKKNLWTA